MKALGTDERERLLAVYKTARELERSPITSVRDYATHVLAETRSILDQLLIISTDNTPE